MSNPTLYWRHLKLADEFQRGATITYRAKTVEWQEGNDVANASNPNPSARFEVSLSAIFSRSSGESHDVFWNRVREFSASLKTADKKNASLQTRKGSLCFVQDEDGLSTGGAKDKAISQGAKTAGSSTVTLDDVPADWAAGEPLLFIHSASPSLYNEVVAIESLDSVADTVTCTTTFAYDTGTTVLRPRWYVPSCALIRPPAVPLWAFPDDPYVPDLQFQFESAGDLVNR